MLIHNRIHNTACDCAESIATLKMLGRKILIGTGIMQYGTYLYLHVLQGDRGAGQGEGWWAVVEERAVIFLHQPGPVPIPYTGWENLNVSDLCPLRPLFQSLRCKQKLSAMNKIFFAAKQLTLWTTLLGVHYFFPVRTACAAKRYFSLPFFSSLNNGIYTIVDEWMCFAPVLATI